MAHQDVNPGAGDDDAWTVTSDSGWRHFKCTRTSQARQGDTICCSLLVCGRFWDRNEVENKSLVADFRVELPQVLISAERLKLLLSEIDRWLVEQEDFECAISSPNGGQEFTVTVDREPSFVYSIGKRAITLRYGNGEAMVGKWSFIVDESCLRICRDGLIDFLEEL